MIKKNKIKKDTASNTETKQNRFCFFCLFATFFGVGKIKGCPGTWGSIVTIPLWIVANFFLIYDIKTFILLWSITIFAIFLIGVKSSNVYLNKKGNGKTDPCEIVIDEVVGQLIALVIAMIYYSYIISMSNPAVAFTNSHIVIISSIIIAPFIGFRFFDIAKPWIIGTVDRDMKGGIGIMMDDVLAGIFGGLATIPVIFLFYMFNML